MQTPHLTYQYIHVSFIWNSTLVKLYNSEGKKKKKEKYLIKKKLQQGLAIIIHFCPCHAGESFAI